MKPKEGILVIMGYWNGYTNFAEWAEAVGHTIICQYCGREFYPVSGNQKYCHYDPDADDNWCINDRYLQKIWDEGRHPLQKELLNLNN